MSWISESKEKRSYLQRLCAKVLKYGPIPKHVAIIMDGNRRFARKNSLEKAEGHLKGFDKLSETLEWCSELGISEVTVFAFSIENFKRSKDEVDCLMELARQKFSRLLQEKEMIAKHEVCIRVLGRIDLLPPDVQQLIAEAMSFSSHFKKSVLNVCFAYTSRDEMCTAIKEVREGVQLGIIKSSDINEKVLEKCMYTSQSFDLDLLVRTSGEVRLSDFLLWQSSYSVLSFTKVLWPDFNIWNLYAGVFHYQHSYDVVKAAKEQEQADVIRLQKESDYQCVLEEIAREKDLDLSSAKDNLLISERLKEYAKNREQRLLAFYTHVDNKKESCINGLLKKYEASTSLCS